MFEFSGLILYGLFVGTVGTSIGIGGGPLIVPLLMLLYRGRLSPTEVIATSLCVVFFNVFSGSISYYRQGKIDIITGTKFGMATIPGAILGSYIPQYFSMNFLEIVFGLLLILLAVYVVVSAKKEPDPSAGGTIKIPDAPPDKKHWVRRRICDAKGNKYIYSFNQLQGMYLSAGIGAFATMFGIGGGVIHVPMLTKVMNFPVHIATATAHYKLFICSLFGIILYISKGYVNFAIAVPLGLGAMIGARAGAELSKKMSSKIILYTLAAVLAGLALRLLFWRI